MRKSRDGSAGEQEPQDLPPAAGLCGAVLGQRGQQVCGARGREKAVWEPQGGRGFEQFCYWGGGTPRGDVGTPAGCGTPVSRDCWGPGWVSTQTLSATVPHGRPGPGTS